MVVVGDMRMSTAFIAVIHKKSVNNKKRFDRVVGECKLAKVIGKPMYAVVEKGVDMDAFGIMPWKKLVYFTNDFEVPGILNFIDGDIRAGGYYT